ncbi:thiosulfate sulfurtransferase [Xylariaceae sp. FL0255]|nr:thiosulfate sulfurtransferase [Xylariaceae sp. FL0255]
MALFIVSRSAFRASSSSTTHCGLRTLKIGIMDARRNFSSYLVTPKELAEALKKSPPSRISTDPRVIPLCASWFLPNAPKTGKDVFREKRIPKARFFDLDKVKDKHSPYPHMLPTATHFAQAMGACGIRKDDTVVVYDSSEQGIFSAPRVGWTLRIFGHPKVHILNNFKLWVEEGYPTETGNLWDVECNPYPIPEFDESQVANYEEVRQVVEDHNKEGAEGIQIIDARPHARFTGEAPEPREGLSSGHMPGAISIPFNDVLDPTTKAFLPKEQLQKLFKEKGLDPEKPIISSCGTGVTAVVIDTALEEAGFSPAGRRRVYDGSWTEWAQRVQPSDNMIVKD